MITDEMKEATAKRLASASTVLKWALKSEMAPHIAAIVKLAASEPGIAVTADRFNKHPHLLNCANGTIDLRDGSLREHRREDHLTHLCPTRFDPDSPCVRWERFLSDVFPALGD